MLPSANSNIRVAFDQLMAQHKIEPVIVAEVDDMSMLRSSGCREAGPHRGSARRRARKSSSPRR